MEDLALGIRIRWFEPVYIFSEGSDARDIFTPAASLPGGSNLHVAGVDVTGQKIKGQRPALVSVSVQRVQGQPVYSATVVGTWTYLGGATQTVQKVTSFTGYVFFGLYDAGTKTWSFTIDNVLLDGYPLDRQNSTLSVTFNGKQCGCTLKYRADFTHPQGDLLFAQVLIYPNLCPGSVPGYIPIDTFLC